MQRVKPQKSGVMPAASTSTAASSPGQPGLWQSMLDEIRDPAFRYGVKFGLAGVLAIFIALFLRLQNPTWALFTVFVLMIAQYVGAIGEKSFFRVVGTAVGGVIGYVLTASLEQQPFVFLVCVSSVVGFCTAMFGQSRYPYAFFLCGLTTVVVASNGLGNPDNSWTFMLWRVEEVVVGVIATLLVQSIFWPRYARLEFTANTRAAFADLRDCLIASGNVFLKGEKNSAIQQAEEFPARISGLRGLLDFGARESQFFRRRLSTYFEITICLSHIASAIVTIGEELPKASAYRDALGDAIEKLHRELERALDNLSQVHSTPSTRAAHRQAVNEAFEEVETKFFNLRSDSRYYQISSDEAMTLGTHVLALDDIRKEIHRAHDLLDSLPEDPTEVSKKMDDFVSPIPPPFWIRTGIKSAIAVAIALYLDDWLQPPGSSMFILGAWVFTSMNAASPGGQGDRRTFHYLAYNTMALILIAMILLLISPMLSSYAVMNIILFTWLFVWGYLSFKIRGVTIPMQMGMLLAVGILGLNGQEPVPFQAVAGLFFGIAFAQALASIIQRVLWPSLPQWELRARFVQYLRLCQRIVKEGPQALALWERARLALIPGEASVRIGVLTPPICPEGEQGFLLDYLHSLQRVGNQLFVTIGRLASSLPAEHAARGREFAARMEALLAEHLAAHEISMEKTTPLQIDDKPLAQLIEEVRTWVGEVRDWMRKNNHPVLESARILGLAGRYERASEDLLLAGERARRLRMPLYMGDYVL